MEMVEMPFTKGSQCGRLTPLHKYPVYGESYRGFSSMMQRLHSVKHTHLQSHHSHLPLLRLINRKINQHPNPSTSLLRALLRNQAKTGANLARPTPTGHKRYARDGNNASRDRRLAKDLKTVLARGKPQVDPEEHASGRDLPRGLAAEVLVSGCDEYVPFMTVEGGGFGCVFEEAFVAPVPKQC